MTAFAVSPYQNRTLWIAVGLSIVLHVALIGTTVLDLAALWPPAQQPAPSVIELVVLTEPEPAPPSSPAPPPPAPAPASTPPIPINLNPPPPQLEEAPIGPRSQHAGEATQPASPAPAPEPERSAQTPPAAQPPAPERRPRQRQPRQADLGDAIAAVPLPQRIDPPSLLDRDQPSVGAARRRGGTAEARQQSEGDYVLAQIMPHWLVDVRSPRFRDVIIGGTFSLQADGTLTTPFGRNDPWVPDQMISNYRDLQTARAENVRVALESFLRASRAAQPFRLPPGANSGFPRPIRIVFKMGDL